jgi:spermidine/putrescine transport system permease protein
MASRWRRRSAECLVSAPTLFWLTLLFVVPTLIVFAIALKPATPYGGIGSGWTLDTLRSLGNPSYPAIIWRTVWISLATTALCLLLALPTAYLMARVTRAWRSVLLLLVILPFWTSFLVRVFAWKLLLHPEGTIKRALVLAGLASQDTSLLYRPGFRDSVLYGRVGQRS